MKVIFVASGNKRVGAVSSFVQSQYDSLEKEGLEMVLFPVKGKGVWGYLKAVFRLRKVVKREKPDIIHAHYSTCGFVASLATLGMWHRPKIVVSILGSFPTRDNKWWRVRWAIQHLWDGALTKSERTRSQLGLDLPVIPNGVNIEVFRLMDHEEARKVVGFDGKINIDKHCYAAINTDKEDINKKAHSTSVSSDSPHGLECNQPQVLTSELAAPVIANTPNMPTDESHVECLQKTSDSINLKKSEKKYIIWCSNPNRPEKNWPLAQAAVESVKCNVEGVELVAVYDKTPEEVCTYMNAADCLLLTSDSEGSPNVIKEAMACNCPIVTTDVGDVEERLHDLEGCFVVDGKGTKTEINTVPAINIDKEDLVNPKSGDSTCCGQHAQSKSADSVIVSELPLHNPPLSSASVPSTESSPYKKTSDSSSDQEKNEKNSHAESEIVGNLANAIQKALAFGKRTEGRKRIVEDRLEISQIAQRIKELYEHL